MTKRRPEDWREARRLRAWELREEGWKAARIAEALGVTPGAVSQWFKKADEEGVEGLYARKAPGPKPRLSEEQLAQLPALLEQGAEAHGFRGEVWTCPRVAKVIEKELGVTYTQQQVGNILRQIGWSRQKPITRASQRDEVAIATWREETWPALKKKPETKGGP
jgi:transposase